MTEDTCHKAAISGHVRSTHACNIQPTSPSTAKGQLPRLQGEVWFQWVAPLWRGDFCFQMQVVPTSCVALDRQHLEPKGTEDWITGKTMQSLPAHQEIPIPGEFLFLQYNF